MAVIHYIYGLADGNAEELRHIYQKRYPTRALPNSRTFYIIHRRLAETGSFHKDMSEGRTRTVRTSEIEEAVLHHVEEHLETSNLFIGPFLLLGYLVERSYRNFLQERSPLLVENVLVVIRNKILVTVGLKNIRQDPPNLDSIDFLLWGLLQMLVYTRPINVEELREDSCSM
ncbi:hypothetical protein ABEB36_012904 [Hypothenemus hampei]|uniref:DUF4817 domain-containing protein n=1 Tax=Hypothenemus hampei TaxID=57062 RepID=A0ABD1E704_HYPHA